MGSGPGGHRRGKRIISQARGRQPWNESADKGKLDAKVKANMDLFKGPGGGYIEPPKKRVSKKLAKRIRPHG